MASSSQTADADQSNNTARRNEINQMEDELSSLSFLLSELRAQEATALNGTSANHTSNTSLEGEMDPDMQDTEVQALLEKLEQLHGFADGVEDRMDTLLAKLDDMLGVLDSGETKEMLEDEPKETLKLDNELAKDSTAS